MDDGVFYHDLEKNEKSTALNYLLLALLKTTISRDEKPSDLDQEVNVYLAHLLLSLANPRHIEQTKKFVSTNDMEVAGLITESTDLALKYLIYKLNADHLLTLTGIFHESKQQKEWLGGVSTDTLIGRGKAYYAFAAEYIKQIHRRVTAVMEVLGKLSEGFERYAHILQDLSGAYFHLRQEVLPEEMRSFMEKVARMEDQIKLKELQDEFLDVYSLWLKRKDGELLKKLEGLAQQIQKKDPAFKFTPPTHG